LFNWQDQPRDLKLNLVDFDLDPHKTYHTREFWSAKTYDLTNGSWLLEDVPPHGVVLQAVRPTTPTEPSYLGSDLHFSQGLEVVAWKWVTSSSANSLGNLSFSLSRPGHAQGTFDLYLPQPANTAMLNGSPLTWQNVSKDLYRYTVEFTHAANIHLTL
jgi:hypothetical protein